MVLQILLLVLIPLLSICSAIIYSALLFTRRTHPLQLALVPPPLRPLLKQTNRLSVLLVTAHPDDECMFFAPTILRLLEAGADVSVLCLSQGNAEGLGSVRRKELVESCKTLGVPSQNVQCIDHPELQDAMKGWWKASHVAAEITKFVETRRVDVIVTFDQRGVSGHANHCALFEGVRFFQNLPQKESTPPHPCYALTTVPTSRKYLSILDLPIHLLVRFLTSFRAPTPHPSSSGTLRRRSTYAGDKIPSAMFISSPKQVWRARKAMYRHKSQLVWFRHAYVVFSTYMVVNELVRI
ncbi:putative deacetylase LmbE-like domain-containing protein [Phlyctochytrium arcticum]|nr:putative deacetylase LmbE-like domain-containing protein [Phlyctochytrium arcticum]